MSSWIVPSNFFRASAKSPTTSMSRMVVSANSDRRSSTSAIRPSISCAPASQASRYRGDIGIAGPPIVGVAREGCVDSEEQFGSEILEMSVPIAGHIGVDIAPNKHVPDCVAALIGRGNGFVSDMVALLLSADSDWNNEPLSSRIGARHCTPRARPVGSRPRKTRVSCPDPHATRRVGCRRRFW